MRPNQIQRTLDKLLSKPQGPVNNILSVNPRFSTPTNTKPSIDSHPFLKYIRPSSVVHSPQSTTSQLTNMPVTPYDGIGYHPADTPEALRYLYDNFQTTTKDILIHAYPKVGNTMIAYLTYLVLKSTTDSPVAGFQVDYACDSWNGIAFIERLVSQHYLETKSFDIFEDYINETTSIDSYRLWKTHFHPQHCPRGNGRRICITRNPKDACVSYHDYYQKLFKDSGLEADMEGFVQEFCAGSGIYGSFYEFYRRSWEEYNDGTRNDGTICWVHYEEMVENPAMIAKRVGKFLGMEEMSDEQAEEIGKQVMFDAMKEKGMKNKEVVTSHGLMNKGVAGRWKNVLTEEQSELIDETIVKRLEKIGLTF